MIINLISESKPIRDNNPVLPKPLSIVHYDLNLKFSLEAADPTVILISDNVWPFRTEKLGLMYVLCLYLPVKKCSFPFKETKSHLLPLFISRSATITDATRHSLSRITPQF